MGSKRSAADDDPFDDDDPLADDDPFDDPDARRWADDVRRNLIPKLRSSALTVSLFPDRDPDVKIAVEVGMTLLLGKPLMLVVTSGTVVPDALVRAADEIVEIVGALDHPRNARRIRDAIDRMLAADDEMPDRDGTERG